MSRILAYLDAPMWRLVRELYLQDKVVEAFREAEKLGGLDSNDLYAEAMVRQKGSQIELRPWLSIEVIESEVPHHLHEIGEIVREECEDLSDRFSWDRHEKTLVSLLPQAVEAHWMPGRWGYFVDKVPYDKICLPNHLVHDLSEFRDTIRHEFMHDITLNLSQGKASRWLSEALSTYAENRNDRAAWAGFQSGSLPWLDTIELEGIVSRDNRETDRVKAISAGYAQANLIARYLVATFGEKTLGALLAAIGNESVIDSLQTGLLSRTHVDTAMRHVYRNSEREIFEQARIWVLESRIA